MSDARPPRPPKSAARRILEMFYWAMAIGLGMTVSLSTTYHVLKTPTSPPEATPEISAAECGAQLDGLYKALNLKASTVLTSDQLGDDKLDDWSTWSQGWREELGQLKARCRGVKEGARDLRVKISDLDRVHVSYATAIKSFVDMSKKSLERLGKHPEDAGMSAPSAPITSP